MSFQTPLRYPGGKARLGAWIAWAMRHNQISGGTYAEPYAGGAGAALYLLLNQYVNHIIINDYDPLIHAFWWSVLNEHEALISLIDGTSITIDNWELQRDVATKPNDHDYLQLGFACFFLNRANRSGIVKGGVIGGKGQTGKYKIDARFNKVELIRRIERIASHKNRIDLHNSDAADLIQNELSTLPTRSLIYLDPPYYHKGAQLYINAYEDADHKSIAKLIQGLSTPWMATYDDCDEIKAMYRYVKREEFGFTYSTHTKRTKGNEILLYRNMKLPGVPFLSRTTRPYPKKWEQMYSYENLSHACIS